MEQRLPNRLFTSDDVFDGLQGILVDSLGVDEEQVTRLARFDKDLGVESLDVIDIMMRIENEFSIPFRREEGISSEMT
ncbi:hypothetical protein KW783_02475, partial [Candidatus Parcubacteria bacterium]|nr:hypothetical protein [Candidatus Parcubacteria bacterium]